jgi:hypothetical protein
MKYYRYRSFCLCQAGGALPEGAEPADEAFTPLVFLVERDPKQSRGYYAIRSLSERSEPEGANLLLPARPAKENGALARLVSANGACVLNTAFSRGFDVLQYSAVRANVRKKVCLVGLGDVGGTVLTGLKLLGTDLSEIGVYDPDGKRCARYEAELNQILPVRGGEALPEVKIVSEAELFNCDALIFTASRGVPPVGREAGDVRMAQYAANRDMMRAYAHRARESGFCGLFCQVSDPVDQLARAVFLMSNETDTGEFDANGLLPEQVRGFGLGVMRARAVYLAKRQGIPAEAFCAFGPHGAGLVIANAPEEGYDDALSRRLTEETVQANLSIRALGYKPYIAPGLSSAAISILRALRGEWHDAAIPGGGVYFGCETRLTKNGSERRRRGLDPALYARIKESWRRLKEFDAAWTN